MPGKPRARGRMPVWVALGWLAPALVLIGGVVLYPVVQLVYASVSRYSFVGLREGSAGGSNFQKVLGHADLSTVLLNTVEWVVVTVVVTILISLGLAQLLSKEFFGRRVARWALIVPWAASLVITARLFVLILDHDKGILNQLLIFLHLTDEPIDFLGDPSWTMPAMIAVGVFVSIPFTVYVFIAGLSAIPDEVHEAARIDGASAWQSYWHVTLPLLRPALMVATVLNTIYVFNNFPLIYTLNDRNPGFDNDTTITFMYKLAFKSFEHDIGMSAAAGVLNFGLILVVVVLYVRMVGWKDEVA